MTKGKPIDFTIDEVKEALCERLGNVTAAADLLGCRRSALYDFIDENNLESFKLECQRKEGLILDDLSMTAVEKLTSRLEDEPSIALKAALAVLQRSGGSRKEWAKDPPPETSEEVRVLRAMIQTAIGPPRGPQE